MIRTAALTRSRRLARPWFLRAGYTTAAGLALLSCVVLDAALPSIASASLPDGRVYEQVSPNNKNGNVVRKGSESIGLAAEGGNAVVFTATGAIGASSDGLPEVFVSRRSESGWSTTSTRPAQPGEINVFGGRPLTLVPSSNFSRFVFTTFGPFVAAEPFGEDSSTNIFLSEDPTVEPIWVAQPTIPNPTPAPGNNTKIHDYLVSGGTPDLDTVYFTYSGTLLPQDASRTPNVGDGMSDKETDAWGFYEWSKGTLREAGTLPDGTLSPFGAVPAAIAGGSNRMRTFAEPFDQPQTLNNEISANGSRAFFVSPDPAASTVTDNEHCESEPPCTSAPPELYVRETDAAGATTSVLVSQSQLPGQEGEPAEDGPVSMENTAVVGGSRVGATYVYASPDGSQAFFASTDQLTSAAPADSSMKEYDYDVDTGLLTYMPGVTGSIAASSPNGSDAIFENTAISPADLELWTNGPGGGEVTPITQLPASLNVGEPFGGEVDVSTGRSSANGSVFVFSTNSPLPGFNDGEGFAQVYRYAVAGHDLTCVSCPPEGVAPSGDVQVSHNESGEPMTTLDARVMAADGSRVFFDTPDPLVSQDTNGKRDVYESENGLVYLVSSGKSNEDSYVLDSSAAGDDVFFSTSSGLASGDLDHARDVYDARVPRAGDHPPPPAVPCEGDGCRDSTGTSVLLDVPSSATFSGPGNMPPALKASPRVLSRARELKKALRVCARKPKQKRQRCVNQARKRYGVSSSVVKSNRRSK